MKKILSIFLLSSMLFLSGCFNFGSSDEGDTESVDTSSNNYQAPDFSLYYPPEWEKIETSDFTAEIPPGTAVVFRNNVKNDNFTANVNVTRNTLKTPLASSDYAKQAIANLKASMFNFDEKKRETVKINIGGAATDSTYLIFEGKRHENEDIVQFLQIYGVKEHIGYIVTGAFSAAEDENTVQKINDMVRSLEIK